MVHIENLKYELHLLDKGAKTGKTMVIDENSLNAILLFADKKKDRNLNITYSIGKTKFIVLPHI